MTADSHCALPAQRRMRRNVFAGLLIVCLGATGAALGQESTKPGSVAKAADAETTVPAKPIPASEIPRQAEAIQSLLRDASAKAIPSMQTDEISEQTKAMISRVSKLVASREMSALAELSPRGLYSLRIQWEAMKARLSGWQQIVAARAQAVEAQTKTLKEHQAAWALTLETHKQEQLPEILVNQVRSTLKAIETEQNALRKRLDGLLILGSRISDINVKVDGALGAIDEAAAAKRGRLLVQDSETLWQAILSAGKKTVGPAGSAGAEQGTDDAQKIIGGELTAALDQHLDSVSGYLRANPDRMLAQLLTFAAIASLLALFNQRRKKWSPSGSTAVGSVDIVAHPIASAALISLVLTRSMYPAAPLALYDVGRLVTVIPVAVLLSRAFSRYQRAVLFALLGLFFLDVIRGLLQTQPLSSRLSLLMLCALGLAAMIWAITTRRAITGRPQGAWESVADAVSRLAVLTFAAALVANVAGMVSLAELLGEGTMLTIFAGFGLYALSLVLLGLLELLLQSPAGGKIRAFRRNPDRVHKWVEKTVSLLSVVTWLLFSLLIFNVLEPMREAAIAVFSASLTVGQFQISLGDIVAFVAALWLGTVLSRFIRFILEEDVFTRVRLPRGVPATISMMVNYGIITLAFFIALAVAGFDMSRFAIIAGALSVGIGFGLQNVVNNFVSGLILAFERPIQVGDSIEVGPLMGRVNRIGIRSSVVRTFDGSEVIVPNADFISKEVINWTLSDVTRRLIVPIGVAYGSNPHQVMELLVNVARSQTEVLPEPEPYALFVGFGDSSLDFELRAWCDFNEGLRVKTELNLAIHDALTEAGIEIPFPQRDLHLRSVDAEAGRNLSSPRRHAEPPVRPADEGIKPADTSAIPRAEE